MRRAARPHPGPVPAFPGKTSHRRETILACDEGGIDIGGENGLSALLNLVRAGEIVVIVDRGTPIARLESGPMTQDLGRRTARLERSGLVRRGAGRTLEAVTAPPPSLPPGHGQAALKALLEERESDR